MAKKVWLDNGGVEKYKFDGIVKQEFDYAFSHIIQLKIPIIRVLNGASIEYL